MATARRQLGYVSSLTTQTSFVQAYGTATGGSSSSITVGGVNYTLLTFTSTGTLTVTKAGLFDIGFTMGGAGGGGGHPSLTQLAGGGGGGGGWIQATLYLSVDETIVVGAGGAGANTAIGASGGYSGIESLLSLARSGGGGYENGGSGITGGGGGWTQTKGTALYNDPNRTIGYDGGNSSANSTSNGAGGGGGGAGGAGAAGSGTGGSGTGGAGGTGKDVSAFIGGSTLNKGGGGGGSGTSTGGSGNGGGANGGTNGAGSSASANTGGGGGGGTNSQSGGNGGSGIVYVRFGA
jgi:hypothetical protein